MSLIKRLIIILYIVSITASIFIFYKVVDNQSLVVDYTAFSDSAESDGHIYYTLNAKDKGLLFDLDYKGNVGRIFSTQGLGDDAVSAISVNGENIYAVLTTYVEETDERDELKTSTVYRIVCLDRKFNIISQTEKFVINEDEVLSKFSAETTGLFLTMLKKDGSYLKVYCISPSSLMEPDKMNGEEIRVDSVRSKRSVDGRFFVQAKYEYGQLYIRTDMDAPEGVFAVSENVTNAVDRMSLTIGQFFTLYSGYVIWYFGFLIAWLIALTALIKLLVDRNRMFYLVAIGEVILILVTAIGIIAVVNQWQFARETEHSRFAVISLISLADKADISSVKNFEESEFYETELYQEIKNDMISFMRAEGNKDIFYDVLIVRLSDNMVVASASGRNLEKLTNVYGDDCINLDYSIYRGNRFAAQDITLEGQTYRLIAVSDGIGATNYSIVGLINDSSVDANVWVDNRVAIILFMLFFAIGSALIMAVWYVQSRDFRQLEKALSDTALGRKIYNRPKVISRDMKEMWNSIMELNKRVEEIQYSKLRILETYFRFAPKNIEKIMSKDSIIEVKNGENIETSGTIATLGINSVSSEDVPKLESVIADIGRFQKEHESILVGKAPDITRMQLMFMENETGTVDFFTQMFNNNQKSGDIINFSTVLFYDKCNFGILGNDDEATTYLYCENKKLFEEISAFVTSLGLGLVITEEIMIREKICGPTRFIGYLGKNRNGNRNKLYEVLDACPVAIRKQKIATMKKFRDALAQYYEKDFYFSRTSFSEILKETPDDLLVKWYVFESDRYLNEYVNGDDYMELHVR